MGRRVPGGSAKNEARHFNQVIQGRIIAEANKYVYSSDHPAPLKGACECVRIGV